jgi:Family of unknown function (DUF6459)
MPAPQALLSHAHPEDGEQPLSADGLSRIRLLTLPEIGPPFDDDLTGNAIASTGARAAAGPRAKPVAPGAGRACPAPGATARAVDSAGPRAGDPDTEWARRFARLLTEALAGARPARQILPFTSDRARVQFRALAPLFGGGQRPRVLRVIATRPARDVIEMTVVAVLGARTRALAVRLERAEPEDRPAWLNQAACRKQAEPSALAAPAARRVNATATAPRWLCTDIEAA